MKHALYEITKNIPPPTVTLKSRRNGLAQLIRSMKRGDSVLIPHKQFGSAKTAANREGVVLASQRIGIGKTTRIWHMGYKKAEQATAKPSPAAEPERPRAKRPYTKRSAYWQDGGAAQAKVAHARKYVRRHAKLSAKLPRAAGAQPFVKVE